MTFPPALKTVRKRLIYFSDFWVLPGLSHDFISSTAPAPLSLPALNFMEKIISWSDTSSELFCLFSTKTILNTPHILKCFIKSFFTHSPLYPLHLFKAETMKRKIPFEGACTLTLLYALSKALIKEVFCATQDETLPLDLDPSICFLSTWCYPTLPCCSLLWCVLPFLHTVWWRVKEKLRVRQCPLWALSDLSARATLSCSLAEEERITIPSSSEQTIFCGMRWGEKVMSKSLPTPASSVFLTVYVQIAFFACLHCNLATATDAYYNIIFGCYFLICCEDSTDLHWIFRFLPVFTLLGIFKDVSLTWCLPKNKFLMWNGHS